jgi:hypothetical protein
MSRLAAIAVALLVALPASSWAAPVRITPDSENSSLVINFCPDLVDDKCSLDRKKSKVDVDDGTKTLNPKRTFDFLEFRVANKKKSDKNAGTDAFPDTDEFKATATFAFRIIGVNTDAPFTVTSTGAGRFTTENGGFRSFVMTWDPITKLVVNRVGTFTFTFNSPKLDDDDEDDDGRYSDKAYVTATVAHVSAVPLPAGAWMLMAALAALGAVAARRRAVA